MKMTDRQLMMEALKLARRGMGYTSPNPMVGAVVVRDGIVVGRGYHHGAGLPHAEPNALAEAGEKAWGATLYVTLEPCCTTGRTPPCTEAIKRAGIAKVVIGCLDCNPKHAGRGVEILRQGGIAVETGVLEQSCRDLNESFFWWITTGRPYVRLKMAMTLDGKIATAEGESKWITGLSSRHYVQRLRRESDAIMVGGDTVLKDDSELIVREPSSWTRQPLRLIWTSRSSLPRTLKIMKKGKGGAVEMAKPMTADEWKVYLRSLAKRNIVNLLLEGGGELAGNALRAGIVNEVDFCIAPILLGGRGSRPVVGGVDPLHLSDAIPIREWNIRHLGGDLLVTGKLKVNVYE